MLKSRRFWIGLGFIILFLTLFFYRVDFVEMGRALTSANYIYLIPALLAYFVAVWFRAVRWHFLLRPLGKVAPHRLFPLVIIGFMVNNILPGRVGMIARAYILGEKEGLSKMAAGATLMAENIFDGLALLFFLWVSFFFVDLPDWAGSIVWAMSIVFVGSLVIMLLMTFYEDFTRRSASSFFRLLPQQWRSRVARWLDLALSGLRVLRSPVKLFIVFLTSLLVWLCVGGMFYLISLAFDLQESFHTLLVVSAIANLAWVLIFVVPAGVGPFEYFCKETLVFFGVSSATATAYAGVVHACLALPEIALGFFFLWRANLSLAKLMPRGTETDKAT